MKQESSNLEKIVSAFALIAVGVCFVVWADKVTEWIAIALGVLALVAATIHAVKFFKTEPEKRTTTGLFSIILVAAVGVLLVSRADFVKDAISFIIGVYIILSCAIQMMSISALRHRTKLLLGSYTWPVIGIIIGVLCVTGRFIVPDALATLTGVALIFYGVVYLLGLVTIEKAMKTTKAKASQKKIAEATIVKEAKEAEVVKPSHKTKK
ncbi:DUF308 domain-containing protein [Candidatus Saccharibacteria bacterium]|nr:DUF308 domain-containing protein [Candidatus Saccharibacteria bacterium]MBR6122915.1 DUF308 domain-containing protein [Candidatus Saccharibacteria bacterium]